MQTVVHIAFRYIFRIKTQNWLFQMCVIAFVSVGQLANRHSVPATLILHSVREQSEGPMDKVASIVSAAIFNVQISPVFFCEQYNIDAHEAQ